MTLYPRFLVKDGTVEITYENFGYYAKTAWSCLYGTLQDGFQYPDRIQIDNLTRDGREGRENA